MAIRPIDERIEEKQVQLKKLMEKTKAYGEQIKKLQAQKSESDRKARTHRLIEIGATVESVLGRSIEKDELPRLMSWLTNQEKRGHYLSRALSENENNQIEQPTREQHETEKYEGSIGALFE